MSNRYTGLIDRYRDRLPVSDDMRIISIGEGNTPLIQLENIPALLNKEVELYVKYEGLNPTGSFKDRGMTMAVTQAFSEGSRAIITGDITQIDLPRAGNLACQRQEAPKQFA